VSPDDAKTDAAIDELAAGARLLSATEKLSDDQKAKLEKTTAMLKDLLEKRLQNQEKTQRDELKLLRERLEKLEKEISDRAQNRQSIIDRKLQDLLSANPTNGAWVESNDRKFVFKNGKATTTIVPDAEGKVTFEGPVTVTTTSEPDFGTGQLKDDLDAKPGTAPAPKKSIR
jgi:hypothetical protein